MNETKKMFWMTAALTVTFAAISAGQVDAVTIYEEDFEGAGATILDFGFTSRNGDADIPITTSSPLNGTRVADGPHASGGLAAATHDVATPTAGMIYTLTADAYFTSDSEHSNGIGLVSSTIGGGWTNDHGAFILQDTLFDALKFDLTGLGGHPGEDGLVFPEGVGIDGAAQLFIELDLLNDVATGTVIDLTGTYTLSDSISAATALTIDRVSIMSRFSGWDVDNILITEEPGGPPLTQFTWEATAGGWWDVFSNWSIGGPPNSPNSTAVFGDSIEADATVVVDAPVTVNRIEFNNTTHSYAVAGVRSVDLAATTTPQAVDPSISVVGSHQFQATVNLQANTTLNVASGGTLTFNNVLNLNSQTLTKSGAGDLAINNQLTTGGGSVVGLQGTISGVGAIGGNVDNQSATVAPGNSPGDGPGQVPEPMTVVLLALGTIIVNAFTLRCRGSM